MNKINEGPQIILVEEVAEADSLVVEEMQKMSNATIATRLDIMPRIADINLQIKMSNPTSRKHQITKKKTPYLFLHKKMTIINKMCGIYSGA